MRRARLYLRMLAVAVPVLALGDLALRRDDWSTLLPMAFATLCLLLALSLLRRRPSRRRAVTLCLGATAACSAGSVASGFVADDPSGAILTLGALVLLAAITLPWGLSLQAGTTALVAIGVGTSALLASSPAGYALSAAGFAGAIGLCAAYGLDRQRRRALEAARRRAASAAIVVATDVTAEHWAEIERQEAREVSAALTSVGQSLLSALTAPDLLEEICAATADAIRCDHCEVVSIESPRPGLLVTPPLSGLLAGEATELGAEEIRSLAGDGTPLAVLDGHRTLAALLRGGDGTLALLITARSEPVPFSSRDRRVLLGIAQLAALALRTRAVFRELREANTVNSYFAATMSHEIRNLLSSVVGYAQLVLEDRAPEDPLSREGVFFLERIRDRGQEALDVIAAALEASRSGDLFGSAPGHDEVDTAQLFAELVEELEHLRQEAAPRLLWNVEPGLERLRSDRVKLRMILKNLTSNALKFTREGEIRLSVRRDDKSDRVLLEVADSGIGIPAQQLPNVFKPFSQAHGRVSRDVGGTGLGLFIVQRLVAILGGSIQVDSEAERGTTFTIALPGPDTRTTDLRAGAVSNLRPL